MKGKNPVLGVLLVAVAAFCVFWTLVFTNSIPGFQQPNSAQSYQAKKSAQAKTTEPSSDDRLANYTWWLTAFTGLLAAVSGVQGWLLIRADRAATVAANRNRETTAKSMELSEQQFALADQQHGLAEDQFELAEKQFLLESEQADLLTKRHALQRLQYYAEYRPKIEIRSIVILRPPFPDSRLFEEGARINGSLVIRNTGGSEAKILNTEYRFFRSRLGLPIIPPLEGQSAPLIGTEMPHIMVAYGSHAVPIEGPTLGPEAHGIRNGNPDKLYLMGAINYADGLGNERWMHFCYIYTLPERVGGEGRFVEVNDPNYVYSD